MPEVWVYPTQDDRQAPSQFIRALNVILKRLEGILRSLFPLNTTALTQTYSTADRTLGAYTADDESAAYTGINNAQAGTVYATVADLNALRTAYENLRAHHEDLAQFVNALVDDLQAKGLED